MAVLRNRKSIDATARSRNPSPRKTVQLSNAMMSLLEERANEELLPVATVVRRAISRYVESAEAGTLPAVTVAEESLPRRGRRGPAPQWPTAVSYVLDQSTAERLGRIAQQRGRKPTELAREAVWIELGTPLPQKPAMTSVGHGFVTKGPSPTETAEQEILNAVNDIRGRTDNHI